MFSKAGSCESIRDSGANFKNFLPDLTGISFSFTPIDDQMLTKIVNDLKPKRSCGDDAISSFTLKAIYPSIQEPLLYLINQSLAILVQLSVSKTFHANYLPKLPKHQSASCHLTFLPFSRSLEMDVLSSDHNGCHKI